MRRIAFLAPLFPLLLAIAACRRPAPSALPGPASPSPRGDKRPDILLVTVDGLRADGLHVSGSPSSTPTFDGLASNGILFVSAYALSPLPLPSAATILSGLPPEVHGATGPGATLDPTAPTVATLLSEAGWRTEAVVSSRRLGKGTGLERGFAAYDDAVDPAAGARSTVETLDVATRRIAAVGDRPLFLWIALSPKLSSDTGGQLRRRGFDYSSSIAGVDQALGDFLPAFAGRSSSPKIIVVTGTHGWELGEHEGAFGAGETLFEGALRVPIVVSMPGWAQLRPPSTASHLDIAPTILAAAGIPFPTGTTGRKLDELALEPMAVDRAFPLECRLPESTGRGAALRGVALGNWKLIEQGELHLALRSLPRSAGDGGREGVEADGGDAAPVRAGPGRRRVAGGARAPGSGPPRPNRASSVARLPALSRRGRRGRRSSPNRPPPPRPEAGRRAP